MYLSSVIPINGSDLSQVGNARRQAISLASRLDFDDTRQGEVGIIVTEAARNVALHADSGQLILTAWSLDGVAGVDILALDRGKGITDIAKAMEDGYSTGGTAGQGLGALSRMAGEFHIYSSADHGTGLLARVFREATDFKPLFGSARGGIIVPMAGETVSGDAWNSRHWADRSVFIVADGLGHGPLASDAANEAIRIFDEIAEQPVDQILRAVHGALAKTRGAAVSIAEVQKSRRLLNYAGVGNISGVIFSNGKSRSMVSMNGTAGHSAVKIQSFSYPWEQDSLLIMHSDGMGTRWDLGQYPGLARKHPALVAGILYRDFSRKRDDTTVVVSRV